MIVTAEWIIPVTSPPLRRHAVVVENGLIREIRPLLAGDPSPGRNCLLPGLVNAHTHLAYTGLRNVFDRLPFFGWIRRLTETKYNILTDEDVVRSTLLGVSECLSSGVTTVGDMSDLEPSLRVLSESPLRGTFYWEVFGVEKSAADETWTGLNEQYSRLKGEYSSNRLKIGISPHASYTVRPELYRRIADWSCTEEVPVSFHASESKAEEDFIARREGVIADFLRDRASDWKILGSSSIEHLWKTGIFETKPIVAHAVQASDNDLDILNECKVVVAHCPKSNAKFGHGVAPLNRMIGKGIRVALGTDSAASNNRLDLFEEARFGLFQQRVLCREQVLSEQKMLEMITIEGARALNMEKEIGSLETGKMADMILVKIPVNYSTADQVLNHLVYNTTSSDVLKTFISGDEVRVDPPDLSELYRKIR